MADGNCKYLGVYNQELMKGQDFTICSQAAVAVIWELEFENQSL